MFVIKLVRLNFLFAKIFLPDHFHKENVRLHIRNAKNLKIVYWGMNVNKTVWFKTWHDSCSECMALKKVNIL